MLIQETMCSEPITNFKFMNFILIKNCKFMNFNQFIKIKMSMKHSNRQTKQYGCFRGLNTLKPIQICR